MNKTNIDYLTHSWNPIVMRCTPVSIGCEHCWSLGMADRMAANPNFSDEIRAAYAGKIGPILVGSRLKEPSKKKKPAIIGVQFMGDLLEDSVPGGFINDIWVEMRNNPRHTFLILTKRPERLLKWTEAKTWATAWPIDEIWPENVMFGVTIENKDYLYRMDLLRRVPAEKRFVSFEPLLGEIPDVDLSGVSLCIVGGESGAEPRYMDPDWARGLRDDCKAAGVSFFMKQMSGKTPKERHAIPDDLLIREFPRSDYA